MSVVVTLLTYQQAQTYTQEPRVEEDKLIKEKEACREDLN